MPDQFLETALKNAPRAGGLAAPAIAAGIGAAISLAGGGAAAAAGATGFLATTAGAATVMSSMGVAGGSYAGAHMARRIGEGLAHARLTESPLPGVPVEYMLAAMLAPTWHAGLVKKSR